MSTYPNFNNLTCFTAVMSPNDGYFNATIWYWKSLFQNEFSYIIFLVFIIDYYLHSNSSQILFFVMIQKEGKFLNCKEKTANQNSHIINSPKIANLSGLMERYLFKCNLVRLLEWVSLIEIKKLKLKKIRD